MPTQSISSDTEVWNLARSKDLVSKTVLTKPETSDKEGNILVTQTTPTAPTLLTAVDLGVGDKVRLTWSGSGPFYNIYFKPTLSGSFAKVNANPISGMTYDVGGLDLGVDYSFKVRGVNGSGTEGPDSNILF